MLGSKRGSCQVGERKTRRGGGCGEGPWRGRRGGGESGFGKLTGTLGKRKRRGAFTVQKQEGKGCEGEFFEVGGRELWKAGSKKNLHY